MKIIHACLLLLSLLMVSCYKKWNPQKYRQVEITDPGEIYSTLNLEKRNDNNKTKIKNFLIKKRWLPDSLFRIIASNVNESKWTAPIKTPQLRLDNRQKLRKYNAYIVTKFRGKYIVYIPAKMNGRTNTTLPQDFVTDRDFYMIVGGAGLQKYPSDSVFHGFETWKRPSRKKIREDIKKAIGGPATATPKAQTPPKTPNGREDAGQRDEKEGRPSPKSGTIPLKEK